MNHCRFANRLHTIQNLFVVYSSVFFCFSGETWMIFSKLENPIDILCLAFRFNDEQQNQSIFALTSFLSPFSTTWHLISYSYPRPNTSFFFWLKHYLSNSTMTLELIPNNDLIFKGPFNAVSITALKLSNSGNERLAYKIKTTAPKRYCVKPNSGFLDPCDTAGIQGTHHIGSFSITPLTCFSFDSRSDAATASNGSTRWSNETQVHGSMGYGAEQLHGGCGKLRKDKWRWQKR